MNKYFIMFLLLISFVLGSSTTLFLKIKRRPEFPMPTTRVWQKIEDVGWNDDETWLYINEVNKFVEEYNGN